jgi:uncharacterized membrane protein YecN with MAPEG domain
MPATHSTLPLWCLAGYVAWTILTVLAILLSRLLVMMRGERKINEFPGGVQHGGDGYWRLNRAHANLVENLPIVVPVFALSYAFAAPSPIIAAAPVVALGGRVVQTIAHVSSGSVPAVMVRFLGFAAQYICFVLMLYAAVRGLPLP